jgi:hypothetical protein
MARAVLAARRTGTLCGARYVVKGKFRAVSIAQGLPVNFPSGFSLGTNVVHLAPMESMEKIDDLIEIF